MTRYIWELPDWPVFRWDSEKLLAPLGNLRRRQGELAAAIAQAGFEDREDAYLVTLTADAVDTSKIEGENVDYAAVRSSIAQRLGMTSADPVNPDAQARGIADLTVDAMQSFSEPPESDRLLRWHRLLFPVQTDIAVGEWRNGPVGVYTQRAAGTEPMTHFVGPPAERVPKEMGRLLNWLATDEGVDGIIRSAIAHIWFLTIHPFEDGNGRIARAVADHALAQDEKSARRYYSVSAQILARRSAYYDVLERTQQGTLDVTEWLLWFISCVEGAVTQSLQVCATVFVAGAFWADHRNADFSDRQRKVLTLVLNGYDGTLNTRNWARLGNTSKETAKRDLQDLLAQGVLLQRGSGRSTHYVLARKDKA